jgi:arginase
MGAGPTALVDAGIAEEISLDGHEVQISGIGLPDDFSADPIESAVELDCVLASHVTDAVEDSEFPLILSGNCNSSLGTLAGLGRDRIGIVWFDAHADFNTPETSVSGFFDGMALGVATGRCLTELAETIPGFRTVSDKRVAIVGARQIDDGEARALEGSNVVMIAAADVASMVPKLHELDATDIYLHIDLDVLDVSEGNANSYAVPGGLMASDVARAIHDITQKFRVRAAAFTAYDPEADDDARIQSIAIHLARTLISAVARTAA